MNLDHFQVFQENVERITMECIKNSQNKSLEILLMLLSKELTLAFSETQDPYYILIANKVREYKRATHDENVRNCINSSFSELKELLGPEVVISGRQKAFIKYWRKVMLYIKNGKPVSAISDILGFRIVYGTNRNFDTLETISKCYEIIEKVIIFFMVEKYFIPLESEPIFSNVSNIDGILIPKQSDVRGFLLEGLDTNIKDYICNPKPNGYQSLHGIVCSPDNQNVKIELQVRTAAMDEVAENGTAHHAGHDSNRYGDLEHLFENDVPIEGLNNSLIW